LGSEGLGIGLSICKGIVKKMGGSIWFETNIYNRTTFYFTIPYIAKKENSKQNHL